jgi:predicted phosphate transport protein (TIGR00153 family)
LVGRKEKRVLQLLTEHFNLVVDAVRHLEMLISLLAEDLSNSSSTIIETKMEMISINESYADDAYLKSLVAVCNGAFFSNLREDFIRLFESVDNIADAAKDSSRILARTKLDKFIKRFYKEREVSLSLFLEKIVGSVNILKEAISNLEKDVNEVIKKSIRVKELEEEADSIKWKLLEVIFSDKSQMDLLSLLELKEFVLTLDEMADAAAHSSEILIIIVTKARA